MDGRTLGNPRTGTGGKLDGIVTGTGKASAESLGTLVRFKTAGTSVGRATGKSTTGSLGKAVVKLGMESGTAGTPDTTGTAITAVERLGMATGMGGMAIGAGTGRVRAPVAHLVSGRTGI